MLGGKINAKMLYWRLKLLQKYTQGCRNTRLIVLLGDILAKMCAKVDELKQSPKLLTVWLLQF